MLSWSLIKLPITSLLIIHFTKVIYCVDSEPSSERKDDYSSEHDTNKYIVLDIRIKKSCEHYDYFQNKDSNTSLYIAKGDYLFNNVKQSKYKWNIFSSDRDIWEAKDKNEYGYLVMVEGVGSSFKKVHIHLVDGTTKSFYKLKREHYWSKQHWISGLLPNIINISKLSEHQPTNIKIITNDDPGSKDNDDTKYDILIQKRSDNFRANHGYIEHEAYCYLFKDSSKCSELKFKGETVWKHDKKFNRYPQTMSYFPNSNKFIVFFDYLLSLEYKLKDGKWDETISLSNNIELDINSLKDGDNDSYKFYKNDSTKTYVYISTASMFSKVIQAEKLIHESQNREHCVHFVIVKDINKNEQKVTTYLANGKVKDFKLGSDSNITESDLKKETGLYFAKRVKFHS